jgi:hypothetical protein
MRDPALPFPFPWVPTAAGTQWLDALVPRVPWVRCEVEQGYFPSVEAVTAANVVVSGLGGQMAEVCESFICCLITIALQFFSVQLAALFWSPTPRNPRSMGTKLHSFPKGCNGYTHG